LTIIGGFARQILKNSSGELQDRKKLQIILEEVRRLEDFLVEVGSFVKFAEPHPIQGDLNALLQETCLRLEPTLTENGIHLLLQPDPAIPGVKFDPHQLRQVILNIAKNSIEAMPQGGTLTISSGRQSDRVFVQICDTGIGISPETMGKIFQPFYCYSTKPKGSGLGLIISQKIMEAHQGELTIESEPHKGTKVNLYLKMNCPGSGSI
jgi:signal transduction histidine kinase